MTTILQYIQKETYLLQLTWNLVKLVTMQSLGLSSSIDTFLLEWRQVLDNELDQFTATESGKENIAKVPTSY